MNFNTSTTIPATTLISSSVISSTASTTLTTLMSTVNKSYTSATINTTTPPPPLPPCAYSNQEKPNDEKLLKIVGYCIALVVSLVGNCFIITVILGNKNMKRPTNYFILNMAISDLMIPAFVFTREIAEVDRLGPYGWAIDGDLGKVLCKLTYFLQDVSIAVSIISLILITTDRFFAVVFPMKHYIMSGFVCKVAIGFSWLIGMTLHAVYLYTLDITMLTRSKRLVCYNVWNKIGSSEQIKQTYFLPMFFLLAVLPFVIMATAYTIIYVSLKRQSLPLGDSFTDRQRRQRALKERKVLVMAVAIVVSFAVLWAPYNTVSFLNFFVYTGDYRPCWMTPFSFAAFYFAYSNAAVNPCICFAFSGNFRQGFREVLVKVGILSGRPNLGQQNTQISMTTKSRYNTAYADRESKPDEP